MRHANSNLNILKKKRNIKIVKINNFLKPPSSNKNINSQMTTKNINNKNILYNLLYKDTSKISLYNTKNTTNTLKNINDVSNSGAGIYSFNSKNLFNNSLTKGNSINNKEEKKNSKEHINIRLKLNDKINNKDKSRQKTVNMYIIEKIKEKDTKINQLQMNLFNSQELLNKLQKEKQKELSLTYNTIKSLENLNLSNEKYGDIISSKTEKNDKILRTNYNKYEISNKNKKDKNSRIHNYQANHKFKSLMEINSLLNLENTSTKNNYKNKRNKDNYSKNILSTNSLSGFFKQNKKYQNNASKTTQKYFSSITTNRYYKYNPEQYGSCASLTRNYFTSINNDKKMTNNKKSKQKINLIKKYDIANNDISSSLNFEQFTKKCDILKERASKILNDYISLIDCINYSKIKNNA